MQGDDIITLCFRNIGSTVTDKRKLKAEKSVKVLLKTQGMIRRSEKNCLQNNT